MAKKGLKERSEGRVELLDRLTHGFGGALLSALIGLLACLGSLEFAGQVIAWAAVVGFLFGFVFGEQAVDFLKGSWGWAWWPWPWW